ncbi:MAG: YlmC/YmxH family sporulation protein [Negativicutes bacterium]|nr:YlmC/YmxH family sporulation protein [Negativicutes bacterium]
MRLSDLTGKEVINLGDGARLGFIEECDLVFEGQSGRINALIVPKRGWLSSILSEGRTSTIPWDTIKRIGEEVIIVDLNNAYDRMYSVFRHSERE